jgi:hypothetical protein
MTTPGIALLERVTESLSVYGGPPAKAWDDFVSASDHDDYNYWGAAEAYDNLTAEQMGLVERFIDEHHGDVLDVANVARAAYDAGAYPNSGYLLTNLVTMYNDLKGFMRSCPYDEFIHSHLNVYRVVAGIKGDINDVSVEQQRGLTAASQFALANFLSESVDYDLIDLVRSPKDNMPNEAIWLKDSSLRDFLKRHPSMVRDVLAIKDENADISVASLIAILEGEIAPSLVSGCL